ncbi:MAG: 8-oxo-dGDP phosphatase [Solirubrobacterales bacterium]|jgi:ADP-ribose pyrophosphatase|nr:8-oxo-dGDP phosphatase [Solirubrobacterales bacterium]
MERVGGQLVYRGPAASVRMDMFKYADGETAERQIVLVPDSVTIAAHDGETFFMVRQPREAVGEEGLLELPAGKIEDEESPLESAKRELVEEIGKQAEDWRELKTLYLSPGYSSERATLFLATDLKDVPTEGGDEDRLEIVQVPLAELDSTISSCEDAASVVTLLLLRELLRGA